MDGFRFILENPHPNASINRQRKRARLVTACDSCRVKKIKCQQSSPNSRCDACKTAKTPCLFGDRDRYQAERGVTCAWSAPVEEIPDSPEASSRKRKMPPAPYPPVSSSSTPESWAPTSRPGSSHPSRSGTPPGGSMPNYLHAPPESHVDSSFPSFINDFKSLSHVSASAPDQQQSTSYDDIPLFDPSRPRFPHPHHMHRLGPFFFDHVGPLFPFLDRSDVLHRLEQRTCSAILSNCIAGLALRFADPIHSNPMAGAPFYDMAKTLAAHVVSVPSVEALHALICITWAEYGAGRDDGFWMYSRIAITMCLDLGLGNEATIQVAATPEVRQRLRLTWWMVVCIADIAASWATGRPATLELDQFDTALPQATDDISLLFRNVAELFVLRGKINRVLDAHLENQGDSSLDWDLSELQADLKNMSKALPPSLTFNEVNLVSMHGRQMGHVFVQMHLLIHAVSALINRPSLLPSYGLPVPTEGPRAEAARTCAKMLVDILILVEDIAPQALRDPFMDLPILIASRIFIAESDVQSPPTVGTINSSSQLARQWRDTFLSKCKDSLLRLSSNWGGAATFDSILDQHGGTLADDLRLSGSSIDMYSGSNCSNQWFLHPGLLDDGASDTSSSFRSSSHELSPRVVPTNAIASEFSSLDVGTSPLVPEVDDSNVQHNTRDNSFHVSELFVSGPLVSDEDMFGGISGFLNEPCALQLSIDSAEAHRLLNVDLYSRKDTMSGGSKQSPSDLFSPLPWLTRT